MAFLLDRKIHPPSSLAFFFGEAEDDDEPEEEEEEAKLGNQRMVVASIDHVDEDKNVITETRRHPRPGEDPLAAAWIFFLGH